MFSVQSPFQGPVGQRLFMPIGRALDKALGLDGIYNIYRNAAEAPSHRPFCDRVLDYMGVSYEVSEADLARIPKSGPVVVVANHCFGGIEGLLLASLLTMVRDDVRIMANYMLGRIPEMRDLFILVDPFGGTHAARANLRPLKDSIQWLRDGGLFGVFPSGEVAHFDLKQQAVVESRWSATIGGLIRRTEATVLPVFFHGSNTVLFHVLGLLHPRLRTMRLPHELINKRGQEIPVEIGQTIPYQRLKQFGTDDAALIEYLRIRTNNLRNRRLRRRRHLISLPRATRRTASSTDVAPAVPPADLAADVAALPDTQRLVTSNGLEVWTATREQIPQIIQEIGRLREATFRSVGEGTGQAVDLDRYDDYYHHLFVWNHETLEIVAAYRLGATDEILPTHGVRGLYTSSLFRYRRQLLNRINPALEMGRSFVRESYQRNYASLLLLWKGIAAYVVRNPQYRILFGPVSINDNYKSSSRDLLVAFLRMNNFMPDLARLVKARTPLRQSLRQRLRNREARQAVNSIEEVESFIADVETELSGIPVLLKQYLKLGGKLLGFNVDPGFSYVLDGLILVDLVETDPKILRRYMGNPGMEEFLKYWEKSTS